MKRGIALGFLLVFLTGCSRPVWEMVNDVPEDVVNASSTDAGYQIETSLPQDMEILAQTDEWCIYTNVDGSLEVETRTFPASNIDLAVKVLSGYDAEQLNVLQTERFDLPEYQFAWVSQTECGQWLHRADLVIDGTDCYAVVCSTLEQAGNTYADEVRQVFSAFGLYTDEGV